jgi:hypothetical protein
MSEANVGGGQVGWWGIKWGSADEVFSGVALFVIVATLALLVGRRWT